MSSETEKSNLLHALYHLQKQADVRPDEVEKTESDQNLMILRAWQSQRLASTYKDLLQQPDSSPACRFFLEEIYGPHDFSQRDRDAEKLHELLTRVLPAGMLWVLAETIHLNRLSKYLDEQLLRALVTGLDWQGELTPEIYTQGYRWCDNYLERKEQIELLARILKEVAIGAENKITGITLRLARVPAQAAGWDALYGFLERGYNAFKPVKDKHAFGETIYRREMDLLERIFAGEPNPFGL